MADGNAGDEWCSFAESPIPDSRPCDEINQFNFETTDTSFPVECDGVKTFGEWNANFESVFVDSSEHLNYDDGANWSVSNESKLSIFGSESTLLDQHPVENEINVLTEKFFCFKGSKCTQEVEEKECVKLDKLYINSKLSSSILSTGLDPVKSEDTYFHQLKHDRIVSQLSHDQVVENWMSMLSNINPRLYEDDFDYHGRIGREKQIASLSNQFLHNGKAAKETVLTDNSLFVDKKVESTLKKVNTHTKSILPQLENDMRKTSEELEGKSVEEVKNIIYELQIQANIYSELLLSELDYRDKLKRDIEGQNNFISSYVAVERKINESIQMKKKKSRYGFFKQNEEDIKQPVSIPYIHREGGPKPADLALITEILKAVERDDQSVSKLISDYVINLGDQHNLQTVIQVRTRNGVTSLSAPQHKKKTLDGADNL